MTRFEPPVEATFDTGEVRRLRPARHVTLDNARMRAIPNSDRLLTVLCHDAEPRPAIFAVVARQEGRELLLLGDVQVFTRADVQFPEFDHGYLCACGANHRVDFDKVWERVELVRPFAAKGRVCDVGRVAPA